MFRGNHPARVDEKGRLKLPVEFKRPLTENYGSLFYITSKDGKVAEIYPLREWEKIEEKLAAIPSFHPAKKKLMDRVNYYGQTVEIDQQGRLLLNYLTVANHEDFKRNLEAAPLTPEDEKELAAFGL